MNKLIVFQQQYHLLGFNACKLHHLEAGKTFKSQCIVQKRMIIIQYPELEGTEKDHNLSLTRYYIPIFPTASTLLPIYKRFPGDSVKRDIKYKEHFT